MLKLMVDILYVFICPLISGVVSLLVVICKGLDFSLLCLEIVFHADLVILHI